MDYYRIQVPTYVVKSKFLATEDLPSQVTGGNNAAMDLIVLLYVYLFGPHVIKEFLYYIQYACDWYMTVSIMTSHYSELFPVRGSRLFFVISFVKNE